MAALDAISAALEFLRKPVLVHAARGAPLPDGVGTLLQIAVGNSEIIGTAVKAMGRSEDSLRRAAGFFIEQILLDPAADSYRCLGLTDAASPRELRLHMALLTRWLHPDAVASGAAAADRVLYASRVTSAWEDVKSAPRRARYDLARVKAGRVVRIARANRAAPVPTAPLRRAKKPKPQPATNGTGKKLSQDGGGLVLAVSSVPERRRRRLSLFRLQGDGLLARFLAALRGADR